jgi:hypothetical protein
MEKVGNKAKMVSWVESSLHNKVAKGKAIGQMTPTLHPRTPVGFGTTLHIFVSVLVKEHP